MLLLDLGARVFSPQIERVEKMEIEWIFIQWGSFWRPWKASTKVSSWRCEDWNCRGRAITFNNFTVNTKSHTIHGPCNFEAEVQKSMAWLKWLASDTQSNNKNNRRKFWRFSTKVGEMYRRWSDRSAKQSLDECVSWRNGHLTKCSFGEIVFRRDGFRRNVIDPN